MVRAHPATIDAMDFDPRQEYSLAKSRNALNPHQFYDPDEGPPRWSTEQFHSQMRQYREANPEHKGVQLYHQRGREGFMAHTEGLIYHAGSVDNDNDPLIDAKTGRQSSTYLSKREENERKDPNYRKRLVRSLKQGKTDPIHVSMGHEMKEDSLLGGAVHFYSMHRAMVGNGNHRLVEAHEHGIERIPAKHGSYNTGRDGWNNAEFFSDEEKNSKPLPSVQDSQRGSYRAPTPMHGPQLSYDGPNGSRHKGNTPLPHSESLNSHQW